MDVHDRTVDTPTPPGEPVIAVCVDGKTCHRDLKLDQAADLALKARTPVWVHLQVHDRSIATRFLVEGLGFHELAVEDALSPDERPALSVFADHLFLVAPAVVPNGAKEKYVEIGFFLREKSLVTVTDEHCPVLDEWVDRWSKRPPVKGFASSDLLHILLDAVVDGYLPLADALEDDVDRIAEGIFRGERTKAADLLRIKRRLLELRRRITPLRDVVNGLLRRDLDLIHERTRTYLADVYDHTTRIVETVDLQRDTLTSLLDVHLSIVSNSLNEVMKKMTVIATVLMTGALIAGIYGMNFRHMPELDWIWGYPFAIGLMVVASGGILLLFKRNGWL